MAEPRHILLCGARGVGKSTLIQKLLASCTRPVSGFLTKRLAPDETGFHPIYIHPAGLAEAQRKYSARNLIGTCDSRVHNVFPEVFDGLGVQYLTAARPDSVIVMDELGFMESQASLFTGEVLRALDGNIPVIAAVKDRTDVPFLNAVRAHKNATVYSIDAENRDALYERLLPILCAWNGEGCPKQQPAQ